MAALKLAVAPPKKQKMELISGEIGATLVFSEDLARESIYRTRLVEALRLGKLIAIVATDKYMLNQFKIQAKKLKIRLVYARNGDDLYIKPLRIEGDMKNLYLLLREPRTLNELSAKNLQVNLRSALEEGQLKGLISLNNGKYRLTEDGLEVLD